MNCLDSLSHGPSKSNVTVLEKDWEREVSEKNFVPVEITSCTNSFKVVFHQGQVIEVNDLYTIV